VVKNTEHEARLAHFSAGRPRPHLRWAHTPRVTPPFLASITTMDYPWLLTWLLRSGQQSGLVVASVHRQPQKRGGWLKWY